MVETAVEAKSPSDTFTRPEPFQATSKNILSNTGSKTMAKSFDRSMH